MFVYLTQTALSRQGEIMNLLLCLAAMLGAAINVEAFQNSPKGLHFVGVGYNLLEGNPEGGDVSNGGVDPGLLFTRKVFKLTWEENKVSLDKKYVVPDQVSFSPRQSCVKTNKKEVLRLLGNFLFRTITSCFEAENYTLSMMLLDILCREKVTYVDN